MNIYELLRQIIAGMQWRNEALHTDATALIDELEKLQAFGTVAAYTHVTVHDHVWSKKYVPYLGSWRSYLECTICHIPKDGSSEISDRNGNRW